MKTIATERLLEEFPPVSTTEWQAAIARDLKGVDPEKRLTWRTDEGLGVKPFYRAEDLAGLVCVDTKPGGFPYRRSARTTGGWRIREEIDAADAEEANCLACAAVAAGAGGPEDLGSDHGLSVRSQFHFHVIERVAAPASPLLFMRGSFAWCSGIARCDRSRCAGLPRSTPRSEQFARAKRR